MKNMENDGAVLNDAVLKDAVLKVENLVVHYEVDDEVIEAINGVSLTMRPGRTLGIVGETGAGKTSLALSILGLVPNPPGVIKNGTINVCGHDIRAASARQMGQIRGKEVAMIFQDPMTSLNPVFTVGEQIAESIEIHEPHLTKSEAYEKAMEMLELVGIPRERGIEYPHQFSGGMKQRVIIAIALSCNPKLLIADEPTTALDVTIQAQVLELMKKLKDQYRMAMILITHDLGIVADVCDEVAVMYAGRIVESGTLDDIFNRTRHPYTEGLFNSLPSIKNRRAELVPIPGLMPDPTNLPRGCSFVSRCGYATDACGEAQPSLLRVSETHSVSCCAYSDPEFHIRRKK